MKTLEVDEARIWSLWDTCRQAYLRYGRNLSFPAHTDPIKTYQWRYLNAIATKFDEWNFDAQTIEKFVDVAVRHAKEVKVLHKGLAALHQRNLMELCYKILRQEEETTRQLLETLRMTKRWLVSQIGRQDPVRVLLKRKATDAAPNLVLWYQANKITQLYISLSKSCYKALRTLEEAKVDDCILLPKTIDLYWLRFDFVTNAERTNQAKSILANDWRNLCR